MTFDLANLREGWDFEAKLAAGRDGRGAVPSSLFETYSAMANTDGGVIVLGLAERKDGSFDVAGLTDGPATCLPSTAESRVGSSPT